MVSLYKEKLAKNALSSMKRWGKVLSLCFLIGTNLLMYVTFLLAYFHPAKAVTVYINKYGEANFEFWIMGVMTILSLVTVWFMLNKERNTIETV